MAVCSFFLQGRCRYGDKCWNEHPRGGRGGDNRGNQQQQQPSRGGYGNRVWINPSQRTGGEFIQPSSFSRGGNDSNRGGGNDWSRGGGNDWNRGSGNDSNRGGGNDWNRSGGNDWNRSGGNDSNRGGGNDWNRGSGNDSNRGGANDWNRSGGASRDIKSSNFSFSNQNRFSALDSQSNFDKAGQNSTDDNAKHVDTIQTDMEVWQTSGQWLFSCYSVHNGQISGFVDLSPEELRQEYYSCRASGDIQPYVNSVQLLANQWSSRVQELRTMSSSTQISVISELNNSSSQTPSQGFASTPSQGFASTPSGFGTTSSSTPTSGFGAGGFGSGSQSSSNFSFASSKTDFGASHTTQNAPRFGDAVFSTAQTAPGFGSPAPSVTTFSFAPQAAENKPSSAAGFSFKTSAGGLGSGFGSSAPVAGSGFGQSSGVFSGAADSAGSSRDSLFTAQSDLTAEELKEFTGKRFTLGQIPLKPPPADLLMV
ncbi:nucleoporin NUP42 isoform X2 [Rhinichthys klamathensis goyatoka]|uniref:nucleoporin NUP42 isoform X2 n=1 Tax=Rhinichthys klamathensis goyatoka TaxID=3034132 RepID=UPI0024B5C666|nr:nucleoporin NUP42 isoform X2 [Rhinichthys klamathensis goyatoka]